MGDVDFENGFVRIQPNEHRGLKRTWSERAVPLWPQLEDTYGHPNQYRPRGEVVEYRIRQ